jgi:hypothetical protein
MVAEAIFRGDIQVPMRCGHCRAPSVTEDRDSDARYFDEEHEQPRDLRCLACGRLTPLEDAHLARRQEMAMIIKAGIDPR